MYEDLIMFLDEELFLSTWKKKELEGAFDNIKIYEDGKLNSGATFLLDGEVFEQIFTSSSILAGFFIWYKGSNAYDYFTEVYDGWEDKYKDLIEGTKKLLKSYKKKGIL